MTIRHLRIFVSVYQCMSITKAAEELHLAQPSVSIAIRELEDSCRVQLFDRIGRRITPTKSGEELFGYAVHILSLVDEAEKRFHNWEEKGVLRIGTSITIGTHILPTLLADFQKEYPKLRVEAVIDKSLVIEELVLKNEIDFGLVEDQPEHPDITVIPFMEDALCAIVPPEHPLSGRGTVSLKELAEYPFLMRNRGSAGRNLLEASFAIQQLTVHPLWESASTQAIVNGVAAGFGVAVLPDRMVERDIAEGRVGKIELDPPLRRSFNFIHHKSKYLTENMYAFFAHCKNL